MKNFNTVKKFTCLFIIFVFSFLNSYAGNKLGESFTNPTTVPAGWSAVHVSGLFNAGAWIRSTSEFLTAPACEVSPAGLGVLADNWLITKRITPAAGDSLVFWHSNNYLLGALGRLEVKVSTTDSVVASFFDFVIPLQINLHLLTPNIYHRHAISLSQFAGQGIFIAFRHIEVAGLGGAVRLDGVTIGGYDVNLTALVEGHVFSILPRDRDTVVVSTRNSTPPYAPVQSQKVYLDTLGKKTINFTMPIEGVNYYIVVQHRNSIRTWSRTGGETFTGTIDYDFTTGINKAFGGNMQIVFGKATYFAGDIDQNGFVDGTDFAAVENDAFNYVQGPYVITDINWDEFVDGSDFAFTDNNSYIFAEEETP